jgi:nucleotide-binding universal stress UspA family protein
MLELLAAPLAADDVKVQTTLTLVASQANADLVVIGAGPPGSAVPVLHDGLAARVLDRLPCDLLVPRDKGSIGGAVSGDCANVM